MYVYAYVCVCVTLVTLVDSLSQRLMLFAQNRGLPLEVIAYFSGSKPCAECY